MTDGRPGDPVSADSREWLREVRANVKAQLFGPPAASAAASNTPRPHTTAPEHEPPARIGRFVLIKRIGEGGMGLVYAAYDDALDRKVAVKLLHPRQSGASSDARTRLIREAQALARLSHPSVIHVYEVGTWQDQVYVAMEFVDGTTLERWQRQEGRTWRDVLEAYVAAGRGLAAAHAAGIVHRDFKAANVLVRKDGAVRVVDFGLARQEVEASLSGSGGRPLELPPSAPNLSLVTSPELSSTDLTRTGVIMGTPAYMAPEQHLGQRAEPRCDQFSYCVSVYEALYGFRPFSGQTMGALRRAVLGGKIEQPPHYTDIPPRIFRVLSRGLQLHAGDRYPSMAPLLDDLTHDPRVALRRLVYVLLALLAVALVGFAWWSEQEQRSTRDEGQRLRAQFEHARVRNAEDELRRAQSRSVSEKWDDLVLAYAREQIDDDPTGALAALKHLSPQNTGWLPAARTISADALQRGVVYRRFDPALGRIPRLGFVEEGRTLVMAGNGIALWDTETAELQRLQDPGTSLRDMDMTADGTLFVAIGRDHGLYIWRRALDPQRTTTMERFDSRDGALTSVALAPDGTQIAIGASDGTVRLLDSKGRSQRAMRDHKHPIRSLDFSPDNTMLASASEDGVVHQWFLERGTHWTFEQGYGIRDIRFTADSETLWSTAEDGKVRRWSTAKGRLLPDDGAEGIGTIERTAAGDSSLIRRGEHELLLQVDGDLQPLEGIESVVSAIAVSHDGMWAAAATANEQVQVWRLTGMGGGDTQPDGSRITSTRGPITALTFSEAGSLLASASRQGIVSLWSEDGEPRGQLGQHGRPIFDLSFSPQGHELAAHDERGGLIVWSVADRELSPMVLRNEGARRTRGWAWTPDGDAVAASECASLDRCEVVLYPVSGDEPVSLGATDSLATTLRFSPSGQYLLSDHPTGAWLWDRYAGRGLALAWPSESTTGKRVAFAYVRGGLRVATAEEIRDDDGRIVSTTLRVWHVRPDSGDIHLLFEEPELRTLLVDGQRKTLLLQTYDGNTLMWRLSRDRFRLLPDFERKYDGLVVSPDERALLLRAHSEQGQELDSMWLDIDSGQMRRFSRRSIPMAWSVGGTLADAPGRRGLRIWHDPTPSEGGAFLRWLDEATNVRVDSSQIR